MIFTKTSNNLTLMKVASYFLMLALVLKAIHMYATHHPSKEEMFSINGVVHQVHYGGSTFLLIASDGKIIRCSSYYAIVWPGMERIEKGKTVSILAEYNKLQRRQFNTERKFWIWHLTQDGKIIIKYEDVLDMLKKKEASENIYINYFLYFNIAFFLFAYILKWLSSRQ